MQKHSMIEKEQGKYRLKKKGKKRNKCREILSTQRKLISEYEKNIERRFNKVDRDEAHLMQLIGNKLWRRKNKITI